ncbi:MAG TPA: ATP-binding protein [Steroidobacter sp.]|uniref:sensor histidine kinase n=1 Tax=Steroidobacter sp. TaxID=1978227 RepID=UPI002ED9B478
MMRRLWSRVGLTPRFGIVIVLALIATEVMKDIVMVRFIPPPRIGLYTREWLAERTLEAVRLVQATPPERRAEVLTALHSEWIAFEPLADGAVAEANTPPPLESLRTLLENKLGDTVRQVVVSASPLQDPSQATSGATVMIKSLPLLADVVRDDFNEQAMVIGWMEIALQLQDGTWMAVTEPGRELATVRRLRNFGVLVIGLALIASLSLLATRMIVRPLQHLAAAADRLGRERELTPVRKPEVPELDAIADSFNEMQQRLKRFVDERTHMLAAISHDLRTPLTRLRLFAEFVNDEQQRALVLNDINEMEQMLRESLAFASNEARHEPHSRVDIAALLISLSDTMADAGGKVFYEGPNHAELPCQPVAIRRAFSNLIDNACKYGEEARVRLIEHQDAIEVTIADRGPGIPADQVELAFAPFRRLEGSRNRESGGVGLGLSIARDVVHGHGGSIVLDANRPMGLLVRVRLPKPQVVMRRDR